MMNMIIYLQMMREARYALHMYLKNDKMIEYDYYNNYKEEDLGRKKQRVSIVTKGRTY